MTKQEFIYMLEGALKNLPREEIDERITFYSEIIDDRMEEGLSEEEATKSVGNINEIIKQITQDYTSDEAKPATKIKKRGVLGTVLLVLGSPVWLSLTISLFAAMLSLYICVWAIVISLWAVCASSAVCAPVGIIGGISLITSGSTQAGIAYIGAGLALAGASMLLFMLCRASTRGIIKLTGFLFKKLNRCLTKKEVAK